MLVTNFDLFISMNKMKFSYTNYRFFKVTNGEEITESPNSEIPEGNPDLEH